MDRIPFSVNRVASLFVAATCLSVLTTNPAATAQDLMPPQIADSLGLVQAWSRPVRAPMGEQSIADMQLFVQKDLEREYVEIVLTPAGADDKSGVAAEAETPPRVLARIATDRVAGNSHLTGRAEAERIAKNEIRRLKRRGIVATLNVRSVPIIRLYTLASNGVLECRDAETGEPVWTSRVGSRKYSYRGMGISDEFITVLNGGNAILVDAKTGEEIVSEPTRDAPMFGAVNLGGYSIIPMIGGGMEGVKLNDPISEPFLEIVDGRALARPTIARGSSKIAWPTANGFVYVMQIDGEPSLQFRIKADGVVSGNVVAASGNRFFFATDTGQIYGVRATRSGRVIFDIPYGEPFYNSPLVVDDQLLVQSTYGNLISVNILDGSQTWDRPVANIAEVVGGFDGKAYMMTLSGALSVIDLKSGTRIGTYHQVRPARVMVNRLTDRLYLISESGDVQCLRPVSAELPTLLENPDVEDAPTDESDTGDGATPFEMDADSFDAGADPFGGDDPADDPFGGDSDADPFGGDDGSDPFGDGGDDPFADTGDDPFGA